MYIEELVAPEENRQDAFQIVVMHAMELRPVFRNVFLLCEIQAFTIDEAATILGISSDAAQIRLNRARHELSIKMRAET